MSGAVDKNSSDFNEAEAWRLKNYFNRLEPPNTSNEWNDWEVKKTNFWNAQQKLKNQNNNMKKVKDSVSSTSVEPPTNKFPERVQTIKNEKFVDRATQTFNVPCKCLKNSLKTVDAREKNFVDKATQTPKFSCKCSEKKSRKKTKENQTINIDEFSESTEPERFHNGEQSKKKNSPTKNHSRNKNSIRGEKEKSSESNGFNREYAMVLKNMVIKMIHKVLPQHRVEKNVGSKPPSKEERIEFEKHIKIKNTSFSMEEDNIIARNWQNFCVLHDWNESLCEPFLKWREGSYFSIPSARERRKFVQFIAMDLNDRLLHRVLRRFRELYSAFKFFGMPKK